MGLIFCWPLVIGVISFVYACLVIRACTTRYATIRATLSGSDIHAGHYFRLMAISSMQVLSVIPFSAYFMWSDARTLGPWPGWANIHAQWSDIPTVSEVAWRSDPTAEASRWLAVITAFIYFILMESGKKSTKFHRGLVWMMKCGTRYAPTDIALRMSTLADFLTVSQRSEQAPWSSMSQLGDFHPAVPTDNLTEMALASDNLEPQPDEPSSSASLPALPKLAHLASLRSASNEWTAESLYGSGKRDICLETPLQSVQKVDSQPRL